MNDEDYKDMERLSNEYEKSMTHEQKQFAQTFTKLIHTSIEPILNTSHKLSLINSNQTNDFIKGVITTILINHSHTLDGAFGMLNQVKIELTELDKDINNLPILDSQLVSQSDSKRYK